MAEKKDYTYASSRVRSVEKNLLSRERVDKMVDSRTPEDALKILYDAEYGDGSEPVRAADFDQLLTGELKKSYDFILSIAPDPKDFRAFLYPYDYHNLKTLMKAEFMGIEAPDNLIDVGTIPVEGLAAMVRERNFLSLTPLMKQAFGEALEVVSRTRDPQMVDLIFDQACYGDMKLAAELSGSGFLRDYVSLLIDTINLKTFVRARQMGRSWDFFSKVYLQGGRIPEKLFVSGYEEAYEQFAEKLTPYGLSTALAEGGTALKETGRFTRLEKLCDDRIIEFAKQAKYVSFGIEPLAAYLIVKEYEIRTARIVMSGLLQGLSREMIGERLRETYV